MAGTQRWYVEEQTERTVQTLPSFSAPSPATVQETEVGLSDAQIAAIAAEAGVSVEFVRQSLQTPAVAQTTAPKQDTDYWRVTLRVRKPRRLTRRRKATAVLVPSVLGALYCLFLLWGSRSSGYSRLWDYLFFYGSPLLIFLTSYALRSKRLGLTAGMVFATSFVATITVMERPFYNVVAQILLPWLVCLGIGAAVGVTGALAHGGITALKTRRRRRQQSTAS